MTAPASEWVRARALVVLDPVDRWARDRGGRGERPRPAGPVEVRLVARLDGGVPTDLEPPHVLETRVSSLGFVVATRAGGLADGTYAARASAPGHRTADLTVTLPDPRPVPVELGPGPTYPFPTATLAPAADGAPVIPGGAIGPTLIRGAVLDADGAGIAGADVDVPGRTDPDRTEPSGQFVLVLPDDQADGTETVRITTDAGVRTVPVPVVAGRDNTLPATTVSSAAVAEPGGQGVPGVTVEIAGLPGTSHSRSDGAWRYHLPLDTAADGPGGAVAVDLVARHPDGRTRTRTAALTVRGATSIPPFVFPSEA